MSYEGYVQTICKNGHYEISDAHSYSSEEPCCCGAEIVWENHVDDTNCESFGRIDMDKLLVKPEEHETCKCCGHKKLVAEATYRVPTAEEEKRLRTYRPNGLGEEVPVNPT